MPVDQTRLVLLFTGASHTLFHIVAGLYLTLVLVLEREWKLPYAQLIDLWTLGALLLGLGAPIAGWLSDRVGETRLMIGFLIGMGLAGVVCGLSQSPLMLQASLAMMGLFGAVYHPVGTAWVVRNVRERGRSIAIVGICGSVGIALASLVAGGISDLAGWRAAFIVPSALMVLLGLTLLGFYVTRRVVDRDTDFAAVADPGRSDVRRVFLVLVVTMSLTSIAYHAFSALLPKWIEREVGAMLGTGLVRIGALVTAIYLAGTIGQWICGRLADRGLVWQAYATGFVLKLAAMLAATVIGGWPVVLAAFVVVFVFDGVSLVENVLIAKYTPSARRGLAYGVRNGIGIVAGPLGVQLVARLFDPTIGFTPLFQVLAVLALIMLIAALFLPAERRTVAAATSN